jgi:hypothetical protein
MFGAICCDVERINEGGEMWGLVVPRDGHGEGIGESGNDGDDKVVVERELRQERAGGPGHNNCALPPIALANLTLRRVAGTCTESVNRVAAAEGVRGHHRKGGGRDEQCHHDVAPRGH